MEIINPGDDLPTRDFRIVSVAFASPPKSNIHDDDLRRLLPLEHVNVLLLSDAPISDDGLRHIAKIASLRTLAIAGTKITDNGIKHLGQDFFELDLKDTHVTDACVAHLVGFKRLGRLDVRGTKMTKDGITRLQKLLPRCKIRTKDRY